LSQAEAAAFLDRVEGDEVFAKQLEARRNDPEAVHEQVTSAGFDATPEEIREAFLERYGAELTPEQMERIAAGATDAEIAGYTLAAVGGAAMGALAAAAI
jgi:predicted ribosomally synthesized peptide with nif11-like leader